MAAPVTVTGRFELPDNTPLDGGTMTFTLVPADIPDTTEPVVVLPGPVIVPISETGAFTVTVRATDDPDLVAHVDGDLVYRVWRSANGHSARYTVAVPSPGPWDWTDLSPIPESDVAVIALPGEGVPPGGTSSQVLVKASNVDYDTQWVTGGGGGGITSEDAVDAVAAALVEGTGIDIVYNDAANTITVTATGGGSGGGITTEDAVDAVAAALVAGNNIDITYNDAANTITVDVETLTKADVGLSNVDNTSDAAKPVSTATQTALNAKADTARGLPAGGTAGQILGKTGGADYAVGWVADQVGAGGGIDAEAAVDAVAAALVAGNNIDITYNDAFGTIVVDVEALTTADVAGLDAALATKASTTQLSTHEADTTNIHGIADTTALATTAAVALKADKATTVTATAPLTGSGTLGANLTLGVAQFSTTAATAGVVPGSNNAGAGAYLNGAGAWTVPSGGGGAGHASYTYNSALTEPPATGQLRLNNANQTLATRLWVHQNEESGLDVSIGLAKVLAGHQVYIQDFDDATKWVKYNITAVSDDGAYYDFTVTYHSGPGGLTPGSGAAGRVEFQPVAPGTVGVPPGGAAGDVMVKTAAADYAVGWNGVAISKVTGLQTALDAKPDSTTVNIIWTGTQAAYDAIGTKDAATLYVIS